SVNLIDEDSVRTNSADEEANSNATLRFSDESRFIKENASQLKKHGNQFLIDIFQDEWLVRSALAEGGDLVVESPERIRSRVALLAEESLKNYSKAD
ncbi:MAG: hypothetical protein ACKN9N_04720, partial [Actinomycetota bacterium]